MARNRDLFDDSTMTFGEHLEALRVHVWKALVGLVIGVILALLYGNQIVGILKGPINEALRKNNVSEATDDVGTVDMIEVIKDWWAGKKPEQPVAQPDPIPAVNDEMLVKVPVENLKQAIEQAIPGVVIQIPPPSSSRTDPPPIDEPPTDEPKTAVSKDKSKTEDDKQDESTADNDSKIVDANDTPVVMLLLKSDEIGQLRSLIDQANSPVAHQVQEAFMTYLKVSVVAGLVIASPWIFFQVWQFVAAGLFPHERKYVYRFLPLSLGLFLTGAVFCFYLVFPIVLDFLIGFNQWMGVVLRPRLSEYISFALLLPVMFGISFQLPLVMLLVERMGIMTVDGFIKSWRMAVLIIAIASMLMTPSDPYSMLLMMCPLVVLYFGGIMLCKIKPKEAADPLA